MDLVVQADDRVKIKESEKSDKYLDLASELRKLWNIRITWIPIVMSSLRTVTKSFLMGLKVMNIRGQFETIKTTPLLRSIRILKDLTRLAVRKVHRQTLV